MTKYAKKILEIVDASRSHLTAEQIFAQLRETYPTVVLATVYNNLNRLWEEGRVRKVSVEGMADPVRPDGAARPPGVPEVRPAAGCGPGRSDRPAGAKVGIPILSYDLKLMYLCEACRKESQEKGM